MKTQTFVLTLLTGLLVTSCLESGTNPSITETSYIANAIVVENHPYIESGDSIVFNRYYRAEDDENTSDDEYSEDFLFQVPKNLTEFSYEGEELKALNVTLKPRCYCGLPSGNTVEGGTITGKLSGDKWEITVDVDLKYIYESTIGQEVINKSFSGTFLKKSISQVN